jgi:hypothetical protein
VSCGNQNSSPYRDLYDLDELEQHFPGAIAIHSKLAVLPEHRHGRAMLALTQASFRTALEQGTKISLIGCRPDLLPMYEKLGFRQYRRGCLIPGHGMILPLKLDNFDAGVMAECRSPLLRTLEDFVRSSHSARLCA